MNVAANADVEELEKGERTLEGIPGRERMLRALGMTHSRAPIWTVRVSSLRRARGEITEKPFRVLRRQRRRQKKRKSRRRAKAP
jgi:hypothetical protein